MSKLLEAIEVRREGHRVKPALQHLKPVNVNVEEAINEAVLDVLYEYKFGVEIGTVQFCKSGDDLVKAKELVREQIRNFVFGEFDPLLARLDSLIHFYVPIQEERREMADAVEQIRRRMK